MLIRMLGIALCTLKYYSFVILTANILTRFSHIHSKDVNEHYPDGGHDIHRLGKIADFPIVV